VDIAITENIWGDPLRVLAADIGAVFDGRSPSSAGPAGPPWWQTQR
jgi:hypothetical protein